MDSLLFRLAAFLRLVHCAQPPSRQAFLRVSFAFCCLSLAVYNDYRLNQKGFSFAVASYSLASLAILVNRIGPRIDNGSVHTWDCPLYVYLLTEIPPIMITVFAACKLEDVSMAFWIVWSWGEWGILSRLIPGALLFAIYKCSMNTVYPFSTSWPGVLEDRSPQARSAVATSLKASFWIASIGVFLGERNVVDWMQVLAFVILYILGVGTRQIGFYPPRLMNWTARVLRNPPQKITAQPWQLPFFLWTTMSIFVALFSSSILYWNVNVAYARDSRNWTGPRTFFLDKAYVPSQAYNVDIVIAHSEGTPVQAISDVISTFATLDSLYHSSTRVKIYTKDQTLSTSAFPNFTGSFAGFFTGPINATILANTGGITATFLHHILDTWDSFPTQTLFLSTSSPLHLSTIKHRFENYFIPALPVYSERVAEPVTSFLNLGSYETCDCGSCADTQGWTDTFHLIPSMFGAAHRDSAPCVSVLLTYGNSFVASADRIRGLGRDVWQMLYDALTNPNSRDAWAHDQTKMPVRRDGKWIFWR